LIVMALWLKAIPWGTIIRNAPTLLAAADALLANSRGRPASPLTDEQGLRQRVDQIEELQRTNADVVKQLADQVGALTAAAEVDASRTRLALILAVIATVLGVVACLLAWLL
jgi:hypothetical protein